MKPNLELRLNTTPVYFLEEIIRQSLDLQLRPPRDRICGKGSCALVDVTISPPGRQAVHRQLHQLTRDELHKLSEFSQTQYTFRFHMEYEEHGLWKESWICTLTDVGGAHPLLVGFHISNSFFDDFDRKILVRCATLWDAQLVTIDHSDVELQRLLNHDDVPRQPWLDHLERTLYGTAYERWAPRNLCKYDDRGNLIARKERAVGERAPATQEPSESATQPAPGDTSAPAATIEPVPTASPLMPPPAAPAALWPQSFEPTFATPEPATEPELTTARAVTPIGETPKKLERLQQLFAEKQRGKRRQLSWSAACFDVGIDPKTASTHATELKAQWLALDGRGKTDD